MAKYFDYTCVEFWIKLTFILFLGFLGSAAWCKFARAQDATLSEEQRIDDVRNIEIVSLTGYTFGLVAMLLSFYHFAVKSCGSN